ncbi:cancer-associated gene 1 protein isoform X3 [Tamandua tetradactyla]|uniref:cancer-associated gene 1 protein isoform X3 n=1 Tax=Tamandua tetradactyla TaxID=48850 RepID=UPI0040548AD9
MSEADAMNISNLSQDLTHSDSPFCMETSSTTSDLPQNEIKNVKGENKSQFTLSEDIYNTLDNLIGDVNTENYSQNEPIQPTDANTSSLRQFQPICKFHWSEAFNEEITTFQNPVEDLSSTEKPELQSQVFHYAKDNNIKKDSFKEENSVEISISANKNLLANHSVSQPPRSPSLTDCIGETLKLREKSLAKSTAMGPDPHPTQPQSFLYTESVHSDIEKPFYKENSFNLLNLKANKAEEITVSSKETQKEEIPEMSVSHEKEVKAEGVENPGLFSTWSPAGISWSGRVSRESCRNPDTEQSFESLQPLEEDLALNEVLQKLKHTNKKQQARIQDLHCSNMYLEKQVKELQMKITKQQVFVNIINKLKENVEELIEDKYKVILEKSDTDRTLKNVQEILSNTQKHLQESRKEKEALQLELKNIKLNYIYLQEKYVTEIQQKNKSASQCIEMEKNLSKKEAEVEKLQQLKGELEKATASALDLLKREKETRGQELLSLREEFQKREKENLEERQKLKSNLEKLVAQVKNLQFISENERAKNTKLQQIKEVKIEHAKFQQQTVRSEEQNYIPKFEIAQSKEQLEEEIESDITKDPKVIHSHLFLNCPPCEEESLNPPDAQKSSQLASKIHNLLALMVELLSCQDITSPDAVHFEKSEKTSDIMLQKLKSFHLKKKILDKEVTNFDAAEAKNVKDVPIILGAKLDKYHSLNEELDFLIGKLRKLLESKEDHCNRLIEENDKYQRHLGNLINKVTSYEEIIECADQRLEVSHSHIAHLEERNKHLEDLLRRPRERTRRLRPRRLETHPKSLTVDEDPSTSCRNLSCAWKPHTLNLLGFISSLLHFSSGLLQSYPNW